MFTVIEINHIYTNKLDVGISILIKLCSVCLSVLAKIEACDWTRDWALSEVLAKDFKQFQTIKLLRQ